MQQGRRPLGGDLNGQGHFAFFPRETLRWFPVGALFNKEIDKDLFAGVVKLWRAGEITAVEAMKRLDMKPNTFYRRVKEYGL